MFLGANTLECESSREQKVPGQFALGNESFRERECQGAMERIGRGAKKRLDCCRLSVCLFYAGTVWGVMVSASTRAPMP